MYLGDEFPNFTANTTAGKIDFHEWIGQSWAILFSHPSDFTPVCTTELARVVKLMPEFKKRNVKVIGISCDSLTSHFLWCRDIRSYAGCTLDESFPYPIIEDEDRIIAKTLNMLDKDEMDSKGMPLSARAVFIIDPRKKYRLSILYPASTGRNFDEILRVIDSLQLTDKHRVATPVDWKMGDDCMVLPTVSDDELKKSFPQVKVVQVPSGKQYLRKTPCPKI
ncbi:peroxiredoxin-6 [Pieris rapae]|uniref:1-Cys peroxiredoxin n=1 Tax=Pieris rapae TaxID=64459 RepID=A0A2S0RQR9_PIERA|nr:peroxiredoxin-6 [Pieris rapae]XP_022119619.2 peroxiredoxin-6 [Pieris rapae]XP_022119620.2 peroxiredoxin-6 [Pieris rapae]AWA45973.1 thioredoxin peroxidase 6 [Pieris rapae]